MKNYLKNYLKVLFCSIVMLTTLHTGTVLAETKPAMGWLVGDVGNGVNISGWGQVSYTQIDNDSTSAEPTIPQAFFNREEGLTLNQIGLVIEKKPKGNVIGRVGPFPGPMPKESDVGFNLTTVYGSDAKYFRTLGFDDELNGNEDPTKEHFITVAQAFLDIYMPVLGGSNLMVGLFHTPLANEIGFPLPTPAPATFFTHPYSFMHGPAKHAGVLFSSKLPTKEGDPLWGTEIGLVRGWNNLEDSNDDLDIIFNLRWRSPDLSTWVDWENIYGNGAIDGNPVHQTGSPIPAIATDDLTRYLTYLTISHALDKKNRIAVEFTHGSQEKSLINGNEDGKWKGVNINWHHQLQGDLATNVRLEHFDTDGVHALLPNEGSINALTANLSYNANHALRIRPEIRYDKFSGTGSPFNGEDSQLLVAVDAIFTF